MTTTCAGPRFLADAALHEDIRGFVGPRAAAVDQCRCSLRDGLAHLGARGLLDLGVLGRDEAADFERMCEVVATVAVDDLSQAFALWAHRMAVEYQHHADAAYPGRRGDLPRLLDGTLLGSTSFASATANALAGTPLPLTFRRRQDGGLVVDGRIPWASNLDAPFVSIAAAANVDDATDRVVFAYTDATPGLTLPEYPRLLALQATASTSPQFRQERVPSSSVLTGDFSGFVERVFPTFLLLQSAFCWGLWQRALSEAEQAIGGASEVLRPDLLTLQGQAHELDGTLRTMARHHDRTQLGTRELLTLRLRAGQLAVAAVGLEVKAAGGRGYLLESGTARRWREAAFLPVQAPTEVQLRWLLSRSA